MIETQDSAFITSTAGDSDLGGSESVLRNTDFIPTSLLETEAQRRAVTTAWSHSKFVVGLGSQDPELLRPLRS